jgi:signal transduction histidine kinase
VSTEELLEKGTFSFTIEGRLLRELGERLVKQPEVAVVELIKNAYDADATSCELSFDSDESISISDNGVGMTISRFRDGWMRIGTSMKEETPESSLYRRRITGEKGIGRFAVRFLGRSLLVISVADDDSRGYRTRLRAEFDWQRFDEYEDLGEIQVPFSLERVSESDRTGTKLLIEGLRPQAIGLDLRRVRTDTIGVLSPLRSMFDHRAEPVFDEDDESSDPGFSLSIRGDEVSKDEDVATTILDEYVLRAVLKLKGQKYDLKVYRRGLKSAYQSVSGTYRNDIGPLRADIRFFPRRKGVFRNSAINGQRAYKWIAENSGVAIFDRDFRVQPYGAHFDDWLQLAADAARNRREPRSTIAQTRFPMTQEVRANTKENWMLRLPQSAQLIGVVQVEGRRGEGSRDDHGLIASADREGFVANETFVQLQDLVRAAVEAIAEADRRLQQEQAEAERAARLKMIRKETRAAIRSVQSSNTIPAAEKARLVSALVQTEELVEEHDRSAREREHQLEVMSLLGVVAGYMTHEFGSAIQDLKDALTELRRSSKSVPRFVEIEGALARRVASLTEFVSYSQGYIAGSKSVPSDPYLVKPRIKQVIRVFGQYATARGIRIEETVERDLLAPLVPVSLYNGLVLNLYTNALKAVTAKSGQGPRTIAFRAWNDQKWHTLEVSDTGIGIPSTLRDRVFDPLFTTSGNRRDPLGSGMGLGLTLVREGVSAYGGKVEFVDPPPEFDTCVRIRLPLDGGG